MLWEPINVLYFGGVSSSRILKYPEFWKDPAWKTVSIHSTYIMYYYLAHCLKSPIERVRYKFYKSRYDEMMILNGNDNSSRKNNFRSKTHAVRCSNRINPPWASANLQAIAWTLDRRRRLSWHLSCKSNVASDGFPPDFTPVFSWLKHVE